MFSSRFFKISQVLFVVGLIALGFLSQMQGDMPLPVISEVPNFELTSSEGAHFESNEELKGKIWVANFIFTSCMGPCPLMTRQMQWLHRAYGLEDDVRLVSISTDPKRDTPKVLKEFAAKYEADPKSWHFLTGPKDRIHKISHDGFKLALPGGDPVLHSTRFVLVDEKARIRGYYDAGDDDERDKLFKHIAQLLKEKK